MEEEINRRIKEREEEFNRREKEREEEFNRREKEMTDRFEREKQEATQAVERARKGEEKAKEEAEEARKKTQPTNLLEFLDLVHVHISMNISVEPNPAWTTQGGITDPTGKPCPKFFREWKEFDERQSERWAKVLETTDNFSSTRAFGSVHYLQSLGAQIREKKIGSEKDLEEIQGWSLNNHVVSLLDYLSKYQPMADKLGLHGGIVFQNHENSLSNSYEETAQRIEDLKFTTPPKQTGSTNSGSYAARGEGYRPGGGSRPDAFCIYRRNDQKQVPLAAVELKPPHKLPIPVLLAGMRDMELLKEVVNRATVPSKEDDPRGYFNYRADRMVAAAVTQTFSYMIEHGLEFGYLSTGEAFVFLQVREKEPETVYYRLCIPNQEVGVETGWQFRSKRKNKLHLTAVSQVSAFCLQSMKTSPRSQEWQDKARAILPTWNTDLDAIIREIPWTKRKELVPSAYQPSIKTFRLGAFPKTPDIFRSRKKTSKSCAPGRNKAQDSVSSASSDSEDDSGSSDPDPSQQPTPSKPSKQEATKGADHKNKSGGQQRSYCTQRCLKGILDQTEFDDECPNVLEHSQGDTNRYHNLDSQDFLWLIQQQLYKDRDADCDPWWLQGARGAMFTVTLASHGYTVAAKATVFAYVTDLKHEQAVYESLRAVQGTYVPVCLGGVDLLKPYYYRGVELVHMMFMAWGGECLYRPGPKLAHVKGKDIAQMAAECLTAIHAFGVLHRDAMTRNMLWNEESGRVMLVDFERSVVLATKQKQQRRPLGMISGNRKRKDPVSSIEDDEGYAKVGESEMAVGGKSRVLLKNRFDRTTDYNHPRAFEEEVYYGRKAAEDVTML